MKARPILFNGPMVRAILDGRKTQTRRVVTQQPADGWAFDAPPQFGRIKSGHPKKGRFGAFIRHGVGTDFPQFDLIPSPFGMPGDRLWVRETHAQVFEADIPAGRPTGPFGTAGSPARPDWKSLYVYQADGPMPNVQWHHLGDSQPVRWTPSIHMPRWASRITLEVAGVRVERLQAIGEADAEAEGIDFLRHVPDADETLTARQLFMCLWDSVAAPGADWTANPWVWVIDFQLKRAIGVA